MKRLARALAIFAVTALIGCADDAPHSPPVDQETTPDASMDSGVSSDDSGEATLSELRIEPAELSLRPQTTGELSAIGTYSDGATVELDAVEWQSDAPEIAEVTRTGIVVAGVLGTATVTARAEGLEASASVAISPYPVDRIEVRPDSVSVGIGGTTFLTVDLYDSRNRLITDERNVILESADPEIASVEDGLVTGVESGETVIEITAEEQRTEIPVEVLASNAIDLEITPQTLSLIWGDSERLAAAFEWDGPPSEPPQITWSSSDPDVVVVDAMGVVEPVATGNATVTATAGALSASVNISVSFAFSDLDSGAAHVCGLMSGQIVCWGDNSDGQLGDETTVNGPVRLDHGRTYSDIAAGSTHSCAVDDSGAVWCWGSNSAGQLGDSLAAASSSNPVRAAGNHTFRSVEAGDAITCAVTTSDALYCWGSSRSGMLGNDQSSSNLDEPGHIGSFERVAIGGSHVCAIEPATQDGYCWGRNDHGQLGLNSTSPSVVPSPALVTGGYGFTRLDLGGRHSCGSTSSGNLSCWGDDTDGQGGNASAPAFSTPVLLPNPVPLSRVTAGDRHACALSGSGTLFCWGSAENDAIAIATSSDILEPTDTQVSISFGSISAGSDFTCGLSAGVPYCWGSGPAGVLGTPKTSTPTRISPF